MQGLDNTAADGLAGFHKIEMIVDDLEKGGMKRQRGAQVNESLKKAKRYVKTAFASIVIQRRLYVLIIAVSSFLVMNKISTFQENCSHQHTENCKECQNLRSVLDEVEGKIRGPSWRPYSSDQRDDLLYDFKLAKTDISQWKAHIVRSINQEAAKQDQLKMISTSQDCALVIMAGQ